MKIEPFLHGLAALAFSGGVLGVLVHATFDGLTPKQAFLAGIMITLGFLVVYMALRDFVEWLMR